ncbi:hypothetical protein D3C71_1760350 [compost metagenome]
MKASKGIIEEIPWYVKVVNGGCPIVVPKLAKLVEDRPNRSRWPKHIDHRGPQQFLKVQFGPGPGDVVHNSTAHFIQRCGASLFGIYRYSLNGTAIPFLRRSTGVVLLCKVIS